MNIQDLKNVIEFVEETQIAIMKENIKYMAMAKNYSDDSEFKNMALFEASKAHDVQILCERILQIARGEDTQNTNNDNEHTDWAQNQD